MIVTGLGLGVGFVRGILKTTPQITKDSVHSKGYITTIYDNKGSTIKTLSNHDSNRIYTPLSSVPKNLQHAFIAIEDERYYSHNGIDLYGIIRATFLGIRNQSLSQGGSTITQQLIKNNVLGIQPEKTTMERLEQIENATFHRKTPTVAEYCEKWLLMQSVHVRATTLTDYTSKVRRHIIAELGDKRMGEVSLDDIQLALVPVSKKSASVYKSVVILYKSIFRAAMESRIIDHNPTIYLTTKGGGVPQEERQALTDEQVERLLDAIRDLPPYVFVMIGLYAGLRREEILALQWDSVYLDTDTPYLTVRRAWHTEHNRPVISDELKTKAAERNIPLPVCLAECLKAAKETSTSEYVVSNRDGEPLSYTQFKRLWQYIVTRTVKERSYYRYEDGKRVKHTVTPVLGEKAAHNGKVVYSLDFEVTPHQLRHTYITNLIHASVDPKTVQYLAGHESSKITMDIYAKVKYNRPDELVRSMNCAFASWDAAQ